jgi:hypothetical protein
VLARLRREGNARPAIDHCIDLGHSATLRLGDGPHTLAGDALLNDLVVGMGSAYRKKAHARNAYSAGLGGC